MPLVLSKDATEMGFANLFFSQKVLNSWELIPCPMLVLLLVSPVQNPTTMTTLHI